MSDPVEFALATCSPRPAPDGSCGRIFLVLQNLGYPRQVAVRACGAAGWHDIAARYVKQLPDRRELWCASAGSDLTSFAARSTVAGQEFWDNNGGLNYQYPRADGQLAVLTGRACQVVLGAARHTGTALAVNAGVQPLTSDKIVGIRFSTDRWATFQTVAATYSWTMRSGLEVWKTTVAVPADTAVDFAVFCCSAGRDYWDNNFWQNYHIRPGRTLQWAEH